MISNEGKHDMSPALLRQRRNLIIVSLIILFMVIAGAKLDKMTFLGIQMTFENPEAIVWFLKFFLIYFLYRYYLYFVQEENHSLKNNFYTYLRKLTWHKLQNIRDELYPGVSGSSGNFNFDSMEKTSVFKRQVKAIIAEDGYGGYIEGTFEINILTFSWDVLKAFIFSVFNRSYVTDYLLPFFIAITALVSSWNFNG